MFLGGKTYKQRQIAYIKNTQTQKFDLRFSNIFFLKHQKVFIKLKCKASTHTFRVGFILSVQDLQSYFMHEYLKSCILLSNICGVF